MLTPATSAMRLVLARSKPSRTKIRAVASTSASTVARDLACEACFLGLVSGLRAMSSPPKCESPNMSDRSYYVHRRPKQGDIVTASDCARLIHYKKWADGGLY